MRSFSQWPRLLTGNGGGIAYGGDYNPEQWPCEIWDQDIELMKRAGVNTVALGIFSWGKLQPEEDRWDFEWLDKIIDKLGHAGIAVDLGTATATAPLWLYQKYPQILPLRKDGTPVGPGSRQSWRPASRLFRGFALDLVSRLAYRYGDDSYVTAWHVNNEYGWNNRFDYSPDALAGFRQWCKKRYGSVETLNQAWGTDFWSQQVQDFDQVLLPTFMGNDAMVNPAQELDFKRYSSDALKSFYLAEKETIKSICPDKPCTTNFMISTDQCAMDYADWAKEMDFISNDHYFTPGPQHLDELLCSDSLVSSFAGGKPWYLMESSVSAVQWKGENARKHGNQIIRDALAHLASGADAINFFQWRQARSGAESFHSAMIPHAGVETESFRQVCKLGDLLGELSSTSLPGSEIMKAKVAIVFDAESEWASESQTLPSSHLGQWKDAYGWYRAFLDNGLWSDLVMLGSDLSGYQLLVVPTVLLLSTQDCAWIRNFVAGGGAALVTYASGLCDRNMRARLQGYLGGKDDGLQNMLGVRIEEFNISDSISNRQNQLVHDEIELSNGCRSTFWQSIPQVDEGTQVLATYQGPASAYWGLTSLPAFTCHKFGEGVAYFLGCDLDQNSMSSIIGRIASDSDIEPMWDHDKRIAHRVRKTTMNNREFHFYFNRDENRASMHLPYEQIATEARILAQGGVSLHVDRDGTRSGFLTIDSDGYLLISCPSSSPKDAS